MPPQQFNTWIRPLRAEESAVGLQLIAPNRFVKEWVREKYFERIRQLVSEVSGGRIATVELETLRQDSLQRAPLPVEAAQSIASVARVVTDEVAAAPVPVAAPVPRKADVTPGHTNFQIMTLAPRGNEFWGVPTGPADGGTYRRNETYRARKQELTDRLIDAAEVALGPFRDHIVHVETATTLSHERYTHSSGGTSYGYQHSPDQTGEHRPAYRTEIEGLWLVGANTVSGHGIAGAVTGGVFCASKILDRHLIVEMYMGQRLVDPALIPPDPDPFDPLELCRGARLRALRADRVASLRARRAATD